MPAERARLHCLVTGIAAMLTGVILLADSAQARSGGIGVSHGTAVFAGSVNLSRPQIPITNGPIKALPPRLTITNGPGKLPPGMFCQGPLCGKCNNPHGGCGRGGGGSPP
jgi:hypothetical protein